MMQRLWNDEQNVPKKYEMKFANKMQVTNLPPCTRPNAGVRTRGLDGPQGAHVCVS